MYYIYMLSALCAILGIALLFFTVFRFRSSESIALSVSVIISAMYLGGKSHNFANGVKLIYFLAVLSVIASIIYTLAKKEMIGKKGRHGQKEHLAKVGFLGFILAAVVFLLGMVLFYNGRVHIYDELHQWAAAIRYMYDHNTMPYYEDFLGYTSRQYYGVGLFCLFFEKMTGWRESSMYIASFFLSVVGIMIPLSNLGEKSYKKASGYLILVSAAITAIYIYGFNSLYVDLPTMTWCGGLAAWWYGREKKKGNIILILVCVMMIFFFKIMIGAMLAASILGLFFLEKIHEDGKGKVLMLLDRYRNPLIALACLFLLALMVLEVSYHNSFLWHRLIAGNGDVKTAASRLQLTLSAFAESALGRDISTASACEITYLPMLVALMVFNKIRTYLSGNKEWFFDSLYLIGMNLCYCVALLFSYLLMFSYQESIHVTCIYRYFCIPLLIFFMIYAFRLLLEMKVEKQLIYRGICIACFLFFAFGWKENCMTLMSSWDNEESSGEKVRRNALEAFEDVLQVTGESKVYMIDQKAQEYTPCALLYYHQNQVNNYLFNMWAFTENGSYIFNAERDDYGIDALAAFAMDYEYLWIYHSNPYLQRTLPDYVLENPQGDWKFVSGRLYRIIYNDGQKLGLEEVEY